MGLGDLQASYASALTPEACYERRYRPYQETIVDRGTYELFQQQVAENGLARRECFPGAEQTAAYAALVGEDALRAARWLASSPFYAAQKKGRREDYSHEIVRRALDLPGTRSDLTELTIFVGAGCSFIGGVLVFIGLHKGLTVAGLKAAVVGSVASVSGVAVGVALVGATIYFSVLAAAEDAAADKVSNDIVRAAFGAPARTEASGGVGVPDGGVE